MPLLARSLTLWLQRARLKMSRDVTRQLWLGGFVALGILVVSGILFFFAERRTNESINNPLDGLAWVSRTLLEGSSPFSITTTMGNVLNYVVLVAGVSMVAMVTGAVASKLVEIVMRRGQGMGTARVTGHILICGWNNMGQQILDELHADEVKDKRPVVVLADLETSPVKSDLVTFIRGNPSDPDDLTRGGIATADTAIILADRANLSSNPDDVDAKTLLTALEVESMNPSCYTCVEVIKPKNRSHFLRTKADELVVSSELTGALLAISAITHGISRVVSDLVTHPQGNEFYAIPVPPTMVGRTFHEAVEELKRSTDCIAMAVAADGQEFDINPPGSRVLNDGDRLLVIGREAPALT